MELCVIVAIIGILATIGTYSYNNWKLKELDSRAEYEIKMLSVAIAEYKLDNKVYPQSLSDLGGGPYLDPWGNAYQYLNIAEGTGNVSGKCRRDGSMHPINSDYDLYSMGPDGKTQTKVTLSTSLDDIIRAENGAYIGLASNF